jgi:hypothetical protein
MEPISVWSVPERAKHAAEARNPERWWAEGSIWTDRLVSALATASKEHIANALRCVWTAHPSRCLYAGETLPMWKPATGEPYAGEPHVRFGGRGGSTPSRPLSRCLEK